MPTTNPDMQSHEELQQHVTSYLQNKGWKVVNTGYHDYLNETDTKYIAKNYSPSSLLYRTQPDLFCCNANEAFYVDLKTNNGPHENLAVELLPLLASAMKDKLFNSTTYYIFLDKGINRRTVKEIRIVTATELLDSVAILFLDDRMEKIITSYPEMNNIKKKPYIKGDSFAVIPFDKVNCFKLLEEVL